MNIYNNMFNKINSMTTSDNNQQIGQLGHNVQNMLVLYIILLI